MVGSSKRQPAYSPVAQIRTLVLCIGLVAALAVPGPASADNSTPDQAHPITAASPSVTSTLVGTTGGQFQYYQVAYPGSNAPVLFTLTYSPEFGSGNQDFGFNVYGPNGLSFAGQVTALTGTYATAQYTLVNGAPMTAIIQVYNYSNGGSVNYTLTVSGLTPGTANAIAGSNNTTPSAAISVPTTSASIGGSIVGTLAGAFQFYTLRYPGGETSLTVTMSATPVYNGGKGQAVGFNLYRQVPNGTTSLTATGLITAQDQNSTTLSATVSGRSAVNFQLQVYNYWPGMTVSYGITANGLAGPAPVVTGNVDAGHAVVLSSAQPGATEALNGNRGGAFNDFLVNYPGNNATFAVDITYQLTGGAPVSTLGFKVYSGPDLVATINPSDDGTGIISGEWLYQNASPQTFGIQTFNYTSNTSASYVIYEAGAP